MNQAAESVDVSRSTKLPDALPFPVQRRLPRAKSMRRSTPACANSRPRSLHESFGEQGSFLYLEDFLPRDYTERLIDAVHAVTPAVNRNYLPGHKQGGSVSRHAIDRLAPFIADLYRSPALIEWLEAISGDTLQVSPADDPHAYALYFYTRPGDHIGWHYDTSYYDGRRYTLLLGVIDESSCRLDYELAHAQRGGSRSSRARCRYPPGGLVFFDGDKLRHRITPLGANEMRVSLTFEYVTEPEHAAVAALHLEHEGRDRLLRLPAGLSPQKPATNGKARMSRAGDLSCCRSARCCSSALLGWQGFGSVASTLVDGRLGSAAVAVFHLLPLVLDAGAIRVLFIRALERAVSLRDALLARWVGESANSLMPAGQIGGPVLMVRHSHAARHARPRCRRRHHRQHDPADVRANRSSRCLAWRCWARYAAHERCARGAADRQRRARRDDRRLLSPAAARPVRRADAFASAVAARFSGKRDWSSLVTRAEAIDAAVHEIYRERGRVAASFALSLVGWIVGTGEVWLALRLLGHPVDWTDALMLESLGQAIRGAAFAIPGSLGVQEGGYPAARTARRPAAGSGAGAVAREARARTPARRAGPGLSSFRRNGLAAAASTRACRMID